MSENEILNLRLWLHSEDADNWWVSTGGIGQPCNLPKAKIEVPDDAVPGLIGGPVECRVPRWLAEDRGLATRPDANQESLF